MNVRHCIWLHFKLHPFLRLMPWAFLVFPLLASSAKHESANVILHMLQDFLSSDNAALGADYEFLRLGFNRSLDRV